VTYRLLELDGGESDHAVTMQRRTAPPEPACWAKIATPWRRRHPVYENSIAAELYGPLLGDGTPSRGASSFHPPSFTSSTLISLPRLGAACG
jgi:hypothetical protein